MSIDIPDHWTTEQAITVVDLLDELRQRVRAKYNLQLIQVPRQQRQPTSNDTR